MSAINLEIIFLTTVYLISKDIFFHATELKGLFHIILKMSLKIRQHSSESIVVMIRPFN